MFYALKTMVTLRGRDGAHESTSEKRVGLQI